MQHVVSAGARQSDIYAQDGNEKGGRRRGGRGSRYRSLKEKLACKEDRQAKKKQAQKVGDKDRKDTTQKNK